jgi:hypothetical protein
LRNLAPSRQATPALPILADKPRLPNRALFFLVRPRLPNRSLPGLPCLRNHACRAWQLHASPHLPSRSRYCRYPPSGPCLRSLVIRYRVPHRHTMPATHWGAIPRLPCLPIQTEPSPAIAASPAAPFLSVPTKPCRPCHPVHWAQALPTVPCLPTRANSVLSTPHHACDAVLCIARPRLARRANGFHPGHTLPAVTGQAVPCKTMPAIPVQLERAMPAKPCESLKRRTLPSLRCQARVTE